jgi:disulfide bond formation protein DsbB
MSTVVTKQAQGQHVKFAPFFQQYGAYLALTPALTAMLGSLYYSEVAGFIPCTLCWYQRILMYPLSLIILIGILKRDEFLPSYVLPFSILGIGFSSYHYLIQLGVIAHSAACASGVPCSGRYVNYLGFITIPLMALTAFILITVIMAATKWADSQEVADF